MNRKPYSSLPTNFIISKQDCSQTEKEKIHELESKIESAKVTAARREQLLTDPNKFTDKCLVTPHDK